MLEISDGNAKKTIPQITPETKELGPLAIRKHKPTPMLVKVSIEITIALVDGNATRLIKL